MINSIFRNAYNNAIRDARIAAFDIESSYVPYTENDNSDCCKCPKSHAKADGAAEVGNALAKLIRL